MFGICSLRRCLDPAWPSSARFVDPFSACDLVFRALLTIRGQRKSFGDPKKSAHPVVNMLGSSAADFVTAQSHRRGLTGAKYTYDGFGNLTDKTVTAGSAPPLHVVVNAANNQVTTNTGYDTNGYVSSYWNGSGTVFLYYDAENRMSSALPPPASTTYSYGYDARNERIWSWTGTKDTYGNANGYQVYMYTPGGQKLATYQINIVNWSVSPGFPSLNLTSALATSDMYFGARRLAAMDRFWLWSQSAWQRLRTVLFTWPKLAIRGRVQVTIPTVKIRVVMGQGVCSFM